MALHINRWLEKREDFLQAFVPRSFSIYIILSFHHGNNLLPSFSPNSSCLTQKEYIGTSNLHFESFTIVLSYTVFSILLFLRVGHFPRVLSLFIVSFLVEETVTSSSQSLTPQGPNHSQSMFKQVS